MKTLSKLGVVGTYVWCLVIVVIFMGLGEAQRWGGGRLKPGWGGRQAAKGRPGFMGKGELTHLDTMKNLFVCLQYYQFSKTAAVIRSQD